MEEHSMLNRKDDEPYLDFNSDEPLISMNNLSSRVKIFPYYYHKNVSGAFNDCLVRESVAKKLVKAAERLPKDLNIVILDGWRSYETQLAIYEETKEDFKAKGYTGESLKEELAKFVAYPSKDVNDPPPHLTGGAVDLTISDNGGWLQMGTAFDEFTKKATIDWFEHISSLSDEEVVFRNNRRILKKIMMDEDFVYHPDEWWHYDFGNKRWAEIKQKEIIYHGKLAKIE